MFILSQNEQDLYNWDNIACISIIEIYKDRSNEIYKDNSNEIEGYGVFANFGNGRSYEIGNYATYKDAKTVMEELQEFIANKFNYIMPKREEMEEIWEMENTSQEQNQQQ